MASTLLRERLPPGFHIGVTQDGRVFFINDRNQSTSWLHPASGEPVLTGLAAKEDLPRGWEEDYTNDGQPYYVDHNQGLTTFQHPLQGNQDQHNQQSQDYSQSAPPSYEDSTQATPHSPTSPGSPTLQRDNFKRGTFKQRSVKAPSAKRNPNSEVVKRGWLYKLESGGLSKSKNWKRRWAVLADFALFLYKGQEEVNVVSSILLPGYRINPCAQEDNIKRNFVFKVEHENTKSVFLGTEDSPELVLWMSLLRQASMMNGQTGFQREPNNNYRRYPSKEGSSSSGDKQHPLQQQQHQHSDPNHPNNHPHNVPDPRNPHHPDSFRGSSSNSPSSNPSFQKLPNFRPYNQDNSPTDSNRVMPPFSQQQQQQQQQQQHQQSPTYQGYNNDPASSPMEPHPPPRMGGVYPFTNQHGQRQSYVSQGGSNRNSYAPPTSTYAPPTSSHAPPTSSHALPPSSNTPPTNNHNNSMDYSSNPERKHAQPHHTANNSSNPTPQQSWQDSLEERHRPNDSRGQESLPVGRDSYYPHPHSANLPRPLRDGFAPDSVRSSLAHPYDPQQRYSYNEGPIDPTQQRRQQSNLADRSSDFNNPNNVLAQQDYPRNNDSRHHYPEELDDRRFDSNPLSSSQNLNLNLDLSSSRNGDSFYKQGNNRMSQSSRDGRGGSGGDRIQQQQQQQHQNYRQHDQDSSPSSFKQRNNDYPAQNQHQHRQQPEQDRRSYASTSSVGGYHQNRNHQQQDPNQSFQRDQRSNNNDPHANQNLNQINHPTSSSSLLHSTSFSPESRHDIHHHQPLNQSYQSQSHQPPLQAPPTTSSPSLSSQQDYNNSNVNPHTYVNFPNRQQPPQPPSFLPLQQQQPLHNQPNTSRDSSFDHPPPSRPPYPAEMRHQIVEEMAKVATPSTQKDFMTSDQINQQRMQQPAFFQYPTPRGYSDSKRDAMLQSSSNPNPDLRDFRDSNRDGSSTNPRFSTASRGSQSSRSDRRNGGPSTTLKEADGTNNKGLNNSFSRNMMDPEAKKLRTAYERVHSLRSSPDKSSDSNYPDRLESLNHQQDDKADKSSMERIRFDTTDDSVFDTMESSRIGLHHHPQKVLSPTHRGYKSQDELDAVVKTGNGTGKTPPPTEGSYHRIRDDSEGLYMRGSAFRPPSSLSGSQIGSDSLLRMKRQFHSTTAVGGENVSPSPPPAYRDIQHGDCSRMGKGGVDGHTRSNRDGLNREKEEENKGRYDGEERRNLGNVSTSGRKPCNDDGDDDDDDKYRYYNNYKNLEENDLSLKANQSRDYSPERKTSSSPRHGSYNKLDGQDKAYSDSYEDDHPFFDPYGNTKGLKQQQQQQQQQHQQHVEEMVMEENTVQRPILLAAPPRRKPAPIQTVKEDPDMADRDVLETDLQKVAAKNPLNGPRLRMSISAADLIGKTHDELVLLLIQLRRNQTALDKTRSFYRSQIDALRPGEMEYRRQIQQYGNVQEQGLHHAHNNFTEAKTQMEEIENKLEVYRPIINLLDNMVTMGSLYGGDNLMLATQYRKHLLRPDQYQPPKKMLDFTRQHQEHRLVQGTHDDIKQLSKDEVDLEEKIDRLNAVDRAVQEQSFKVSSFKEDKELMEKALSGILRQQDQNRHDPREMPRLTQQQRTLEKEISRVTQQLAEASKELEATTAENNKLEHEIALLRTKVHWELSRSKSVPSLASDNVRTKMKMEKELAKVQDLMQGLNQQGAKLSQAMNTLRRSSSGANIAAALDDTNEQTKPSGTYIQTDLDSGEQIDLAGSSGLDSGTGSYPAINHHRQNAANELDVDQNDEETKKFFGLLPRDKPKGQTVRDVKRLSEARKEKREDPFGEEVSLRVSNVDNEVSSIIHARIAKDTQAVPHHAAAPSGDSTWDSAGHPLYENLPRYGSMPALADDKINTTNNNSIIDSSLTIQSAASSRRSSIVLLAPKPFVPYQDKTARPFRSEMALNLMNNKKENNENNNTFITTNNGFNSMDGGGMTGVGNHDNNNNNSSIGYFTKGKNINLDRPYHSHDLLATDDHRPHHNDNDLDLSHHSYSHNERDLGQNGQFHAKPTNISPKDATMTNGESPITAQLVDSQQSAPPVDARGQDPPSLFTPTPWGTKKTTRGRYSTISSSQPLQMGESSHSLLLNPTLHSSAGDLILNKSIDDVPDIVKSSQGQGRGEDQIDGDVIDREILSMPDKVLIPERYDAEADAEDLTEDEKNRRQERSERIRKVLTTQSVLSISQPDISQLQSRDIHSRLQQEKKERAHYLALNQELARQVTQQSKKQAAARRKTWSGAQFADAKKQYEQEQELLNVSSGGGNGGFSPLRSPDPVRKRSELTLRNL